MSREEPNKFVLTVNDEHDVAYLRLPRRDEKKDKKTAKTVRLFELLDGYTGADVVFDLDDEGELLGIEILIWWWSQMLLFD